MKHEILHLDETGSTNNVVRQMAEEGAPDGLTVWADLQTAGKGRAGRAWTAEKGENATFSVLVRGESDGLVFRAALAAAKTVRKMTGADCRIKWPNDIVIGGKKVAGILCESAFSGDKPEFMIMGIGVNLKTEVFPQELPYAGSVKTQTGKTVEPFDFINCFLGFFDEALEGPLSDVLEAITPMSATVGRTVRAGEITGFAERLDSDGSLIISKDGILHRIIYGDVSVRGLYGYVDE